MRKLMTCTALDACRLLHATHRHSVRAHTCARVRARWPFGAVWYGVVRVGRCGSVWVGVVRCGTACYGMDGMGWDGMGSGSVFVVATGRAVRIGAAGIQRRFPMVVSAGSLW